MLALYFTTKLIYRDDIIMLVYDVPETAPTAPYNMEQPSITLASHSTVPDMVRLEP